MFRLEKIFQNDDFLFINTYIFVKTFVVFLSIYIFSILVSNSIHDLINFSIFKNSELYNFSIYVSSFYFVVSFFFRLKKRYAPNFLTFLQQDIYPIFPSLLLTFTIFFFLNDSYTITITFILLLIVITFNLFVVKKIINYLYNYLIDKNIIQRNIMLVGSTDSIRLILKENIDKINIYKCCLITEINLDIISKLRLEFKIPVFYKADDIRSILEYHSLGQIWILDDKKNNISDYLKIILRFSIDLLVVNLKDKPILGSENIINNKYQFVNYEISRFYGFNLLIKILIDKILSLFFLIILSPVFIISLLLIYLEDGYPLFFTQDRTGWDGRRFKIFKIRSLKNNKFDKKVQVTNNDKRLLKIGKIIRRFSIDELPQFYNVLVGNMSIVGPRPHMVEHDILYSSLFDSFLKRHKTNPGLTGWAQVSGFRGATPTTDLMKKRMEHDLWYLKNWTIWLDLYIMFKTFYIIFKNPG
ncbi:exopolysaccharide biosynthesis polyprenyl glycosylphosphotransferase [Alphaproteobacteria bacterium]|nr:exopolysaccharide biosynthesis polyprenyl glycosylphosphotransferase [Alphaproteobacteria bacterium]